MQQKLSVVLPVTLRERVSGKWRHSADEGALRRTQLALASFVKNFNQEDLHEFRLVSPAVDLFELDKLLASVTRDPRYQVVDELELCPEVLAASKTHKRAGWITQQLIKLQIASSFDSTHYLTLDSDILCIKPFSYASLVADGRALTNLEHPADYQRIYVARDCQHELTTKRKRYQGAATLLGYRRPDTLRHFYGETPVVLNTHSIRELTEFLSLRFGEAWFEGLASQNFWSEYSLYFQFLEMNGRLEQVCALTGCNAVLDLEKSVWLPSEGYRSPRPYDAAHFTHDLQERGFFVAIQSWLPSNMWLPARCGSVRAFYEEVETWLL